MQNCSERSKILYKGGPYSPQKTLFQVLEQFDIHIPEELRFNRFRSVYDFESRLLPVENGNYMFKHVPTSVSIASNVEGFQTPKTFCNENPLDLVRDFVHYLDAISKKQALLNYGDYREILNSLYSKIKECEERKNLKQVARLKFALKRLNNFIYQMPTVGFNSQAYDLVLIKPYFFEVLKEMKAFEKFDKNNPCLDKETHYNRQINKGTTMLAFETSSLKFLDILNFCPPQVNYKKYLEAYGSGGGQKKYFFPYEKMTSFAALMSTNFPTYADFFSSLKKENTLEEGQGPEHGLKN